LSVRGQVVIGNVGLKPIILAPDALQVSPSDVAVLPGAKLELENLEAPEWKQTITLRGQKRIPASWGG